MYRSFILILNLVGLASSNMLAYVETTLLDPAWNSAVTQEKDSAQLYDKSTYIVIGKITSVQHPKKDRRIGISEYEIKVVEILKGKTKLISFGREKDFKVQIVTRAPDEPDISGSLKEGTIAIFFIQSFKGIYATLTNHRTIAIFPEGVTIYKKTK